MRSAPFLLACLLTSTVMADEPSRHERRAQLPAEARLEIAGTVIDADTGAPVPNARLALEIRTIGGDRLGVTADAEQDGTFRFPPVPTGRHTLHTAATGYPIAELNYISGEDETSRNVTVTVQRQPATLLRVVDARGMPMRNAEVRVYRDQTVVVQIRAGTDGTVPIYIPKGETRDVWVVPRDGSLAVARISSGVGEVRLVVPDGTSRIVVRTESEARQPIPRIMVDVRYNGFLLPADVMQALVGRGSRVLSGEDGRIVLQQMPPGTYELWPVVEPHGFRTAAAQGRAPVTMVAGPGENVAVLTFASRE